MPSYQVRETFFRPERPCTREHKTLPADIVNGLRRLLSRAGGGCLFLPLRSMQYQAVIDRDEVVFVDAVGGYAHQDGEGGRLIRIAWCWQCGPRDSVSEPVPCEIIHYFPDLKEVQWQLVGEVRAALEVAESRRRERAAPACQRRVVPFRRIR
jgi:hypothetical protein